MLKDLHVIHRLKPRQFDSGAPLFWETCLRSLAFVRGDQLVLRDTTDELFSHAEAYRFILEIICGLHSPILGETEVFGQFKQFVGKWAKGEPVRAPLIQRWLMDAKEIRAAHLNKLGVQSYGSWIKRHLKPEPVHILGAGQLVQEILPHVQKKSLLVQLHVRDPRKVAGSVQIKNGGFKGGAVIIAAPMSAQEIEAWMGTQKANQIFDLRGTAAEDPIGKSIAKRLHRLQDIFSEIQSTRAQLQPVVEKVRQEILVRSQRVEAFAQIRPQGWDDICA